MATSIPARLIEFILLGPVDDRRQLQDSPILGDVWIEYGRRPAEAVDLLISPYGDRNAGALAVRLDQELYGKPEDEKLTETREAGSAVNVTEAEKAEKAAKAAKDEAKIAYVQGLVAARLTFAELLRHVVPKAKWWTAQWREGEKEPEGERKREHPVWDLLRQPARIAADLDKIVEAAQRWQSEQHATIEIPTTSRFVALAALLCWAADAAAPRSKTGGPDGQIADILKRLDTGEAARLLHALAEDPPPAAVDEEGEPQPLVYLVSLNRSAMPALERSVPAVKADAAHTLFKVKCGDIGWAVLDSGIDGGHRAFLEGGKSRVKASYDFANLRRIVSLSNGRPGVRKRNVDEILKMKDRLVTPPTAEQADADLEQLARDAANGSPVRWDVVEKYVRIDPGTRPLSPHGTHVAGILGGCADPDQGEHAGMCPDIKLYDFRILAPGMKDTEFAIIAAMQFIRYLNERGSLKAIHGVNLSLSIPHDVRNFACGRTPICNESERLVDSGVVVVAAAGNHGYKNFQTLEGPYAGYAAFSITDPGNAESVITVGSTHRFWPHTYGVSFFSSRGPTGDGRVKPDLVAPGERIHAPLERDGGRSVWGDLDGTSMAAPHVSGAAAMLMARYTELIEQPRRIKQILCESATDLGRERTFQGHGMLDVLRAFQSL